MVVTLKEMLIRFSQCLQYSTFRKDFPYFDHSSPIVLEFRFPEYLEFCIFSRGEPSY